MAGLKMCFLSNETTELELLLYNFGQCSEFYLNKHS